MESINHESDALRLVRYLAEGCAQKGGMGTMSPAIYDTAWVSMVSKNVNGRAEWLFPECFQYILSAQSPDGGWGSPQSSNDDRLLGTMAALLAVLRHGPRSTAEYGSKFHYEDRVAKAISFLQTELEQWDVESSVQVGFELLVPAHLSMLQKEDIFFAFPCRDSLMTLNARKLGKFNPQILYSTQKSTLLHSLEAFIGIVDFNKLSHHKSFGSMFASPSSTAAYLMNCSPWDEEAEEYIRNVILNGAGKSSGGVPSAFPSTIFETSWVSDMASTRTRRPVK